jgi:hypothetical protein
MKIVGMEGMAPGQVADELRRGGRFVVYQYCISVIVLTFRRGSDIHFVRTGRGSVGAGLAYSALSAVVGWWGIPWGPIYTVQSLVTNFRGGKDVTQEVLAALQQAAA